MIAAIEKAMNEAGFFPSHITPDGKMHRFKRDDSDKGKSAWMVAHQNNSTKGGEVFYVAVWGDWREFGETYKFCSLTTQSSADKKNIESQIKKAEKLRKKEEEQNHLECSIEAQKIWVTLQDAGITPYLDRKGISLNGAKIKNDVVVVPVRDVEGKLWGLQKIFPDGKKLFMAGTKKKGNFHVLRGPKPITECSVIYICEGFATAGTIHKATGETVVVAFDSGNLEPVCKTIRRHCPNAGIIVCGDDDRGNKNGNPGREAAESAAQAVLGKAIFPSFPDEDQASTDWNDLQATRGIEEVVSQLTEAPAPERHYIVALGHRGLGYFYTSSHNRQIVGLTSHGPDSLTCLQPLEYWEQLYATKTGVDWQKAASDLKSDCHKKGIFNAQHVRGLGTWLDDGRVVVHLGDRLWIAGQEHDLHSIKTRHIYSLEERRAPLTGTPLQDCSVLLEAIHNIAWAREQDAIFFAGWLMTAMLSGVLQWRPHMWLIGGTGAGKSRIYEIIAKVMGGHVTTLAGGTSEAGLRRSVRGSALPLIFDEFELNNNATLVENQKILAFMRQASSDTVAQIIKADGGAGTVSYQPRFCAFVAGIRPSFDNEADRNRFTLIELDRTKQNAAQWSRVKDALAKIDNGYTNGLFLRALGLIETFRKNTDTFASVLGELHYARFAQQYAPILAGYCALEDSEVICREEAAGFIDRLQLENEVTDIRDMNDERDALSHILHSKVRCGERGDRAILELVTAAKGFDVDSQAANDHLQRFGLKVIEGKLFVAGRHPELAKLFEKTRFSINWNYSLSRIQDAQKGVVIRILGKSIKGVMIPVDAN